PHPGIPVRCPVDRHLSHGCLLPAAYAVMGEPLLACCQLVHYFFYPDCRFGELDRPASLVGVRLAAQGDDVAVGVDLDGSLGEGSIQAESGGNALAQGGGREGVALERVPAARQLAADAGTFFFELAGGPVIDARQPLGVLAVAPRRR